MTCLLAVASFILRFLGSFFFFLGYIRSLFQKGGKVSDLTDVWKCFYLLQCFPNISMSWQAVKIIFKRYPGVDTRGFLQPEWLGRPSHPVPQLSSPRPQRNKLSQHPCLRQGPQSGRCWLSLPSWATTWIIKNSRFKGIFPQYCEKTVFKCCLLCCILNGVSETIHVVLLPFLTPWPGFGLLCFPSVLFGSEWAHAVPGLTSRKPRQQLFSCHLHARLSTASFWKAWRVDHASAFPPRLPSPTLGAGLLSFSAQPSNSLIHSSTTQLVSAAGKVSVSIFFHF